MEPQAKEILRKERDRLSQEEERLVRELERIEHDLAEIQASIEAIDRALGDKIRRAVRRTPAQDLSRLPVIDIVREALKRSGRPLDAEGIMGLLQEWGLKNVKRTSVRTALVRLAEEPDVNRVERGVYQFVGASSQTEE